MRGGNMAAGQALDPQSGIIVHVTIQIGNKGEVTGVKPDRFEISKSKHQQLLWQVSDPDFHFNVDFGADSPFEYSQFSDAEPYSGLVRREVLGDPAKYYTYKVTVAPDKTVNKKSNKAASKAFDPGGVVNP
jgi:hypothetical protein